MASTLAANRNQERGLSLSILAVTAGSATADHPAISPFVAEQIRALRECGCTVHLGAIENRRSIRTTARCVADFRRQVHEHKIGVVHAHYGSAVSAIGLASRGPAAYVVSFGGSDLLGVPQKSFYWRARQGASFAMSVISALSADAVIVKSAELRSVLPRRVADKAVVMPNGVNLRIFAPIARDEARGTLGWDPEASIVLFNASHGSNVHVKNHRLACEAVEVLRHTIRDVRFIMIGNDPVRMMPTMLSAADCLLVTSLHEGSPNIVKEAMACNLPVVSVPCGDVVERLSDVDVGKVCPYDPCLLANAMSEYLLERVRSRGRAALAAQKLDSGQVAERMVALFEQAVDHRG